eukprot:TRINITY_DN10919_c0_g1_i1.p1 TRINITY_DN10919_c0_g1~~TRINITY_DN10919_c0_g1_i1.p1  ORF type:complete len:458 (+),score=111.25 TRINITY_DN10919_c0_g1_i1:437-1810(+)
MMKWRKSRENRLRNLQQSMETKDITEKQKMIKLQELHFLESQYLRRRRIKINLDSFERIKLIGRGGYGEVFLVRQKNTNRVFAMKIMKKSKLIRRKQEEHVNSERNTLVDVNEIFKNNKWIIKLYYSFQDQENLYLVTEYCPGGDLMNSLIEKDIFSLYATKFYIAELVLAICSVHSMGVIHRDIKPDNILLDANGHLKLTDFGLCTGNFDKPHYNITPTKKQINNSNDNSENDFQFNSLKKGNHKPLCYSHVGTPDYIAPEVILSGKQGYSESCDIWSVGVIAFECLIGCTPFDGNTPNQIKQNVLCYEEILNNYNNWQRQELDLIDRDARDFILQLLCSADYRLGKNGIEDFKAHPFFNSIDFDNIRSQSAPYKPKLVGACDTSRFPSDQILEVENNSSNEDSNRGECNCHIETEKPLCSIHDKYHKNEHYIKNQSFIGFTYNSFQALQELWQLS